MRLRQFVTVKKASLLITCMFHSLSAFSAGTLTTCAIRWDAWYSDLPTASAKSTARTLGPSKWQFRAPVHARITGTDSIDWENSSQQTFDAEIVSAQKNHLTCWLYLVYGTGNHVDLNASQMNNGLKFHRSSNIRNHVKYALIVPTSLLGTVGRFDEANSVIVGLMKDSNYQNVLAARPLLVIYFSPNDIRDVWKNEMQNLRAEVDALRSSAISAKLRNPYIVVTTRSDAVRSSLGADAIGSYNGPGASETSEAWEKYESEVEASWHRDANAALKDSIPILMTGWDQRPRFERPPSWQTSPNPEASGNFYVIPPTNAQLAQEFSHAITFVKKTRNKNPAQLMFVYSWNENDEGGNALNPTIGDPLGRRLATISHLLAQ